MHLVGLVPEVDVHRGAPDLERGVERLEVLGAVRQVDRDLVAGLQRRPTARGGVRAESRGRRTHAHVIRRSPQTSASRSGTIAATPSHTAAKLHPGTRGSVLRFRTGRTAARPADRHASGCMLYSHHARQGKGGPCDSSPAQDASFLYVETPTTPSVGSVAHDLRPVDRARRHGPLQGDPRRLREPSPPGEVPALEDRARAHGPRSPVLGGRRRLRHRVPHPAPGAAEARELATALHPGRAARRAPPRPLPASVGAVRDRGARQRRRVASRIVRPPHQDPPCCDRRRRRHRARQLDARPLPGDRAGRRGRPGMVARTGTDALGAPRACAAEPGAPSHALRRSDAAELRELPGVPAVPTNSSRSRATSRWRRRARRCRTPGSTVH